MSTDKLRDLEREIADKLNRIEHLEAEVERLQAAVEEERKLLRMLMDDDVEVTEEDVAEVRREMEEAGEIPVIPPEQRID